MKFLNAILQNTGATRHVILVGCLAIKVPSLTRGWRLFLHGLLANMQEREFGKANLEGFCPVLFSIPGGFLTIMRRARLLTEDEWLVFDPERFCDRSDYYIPSEHKRDSFGVIDWTVVAIDYGS